jgi:hypothetical protein
MEEYGIVRRARFTCKCVFSYIENFMNPNAEIFSNSVRYPYETNSCPVFLHLFSTLLKTY